MFENSCLYRWKRKNFLRMQRNCTPNFNTTKCVQEGTNCNQTPKECSDWNLIGNNRGITGDNCTLLTAPTNQRCLLVSEGSGQVCKAHHKVCTTINLNTNSECTNNIPENPPQNCDWTGTPASCQPVSRHCDDTDLYYKNKTLCKTLTIPDYDKKNIFIKEKTVNQNTINVQIELLQVEIIVNLLLL